MKVNSTHKAKTDCPVVGCKVIQKRMDHLKKHYVSMVVWEGDNPVSSGSAEYKRARHRSKRAVKSSLFCQTLKLIEDGEVTFSKNLIFWRSEALCHKAAGGDLSLNSGRPAQLTKIKRNYKGAGCQARCYARLMAKIGPDMSVKCNSCGHLNFKRYNTCLKCKAELIKENDNNVVIFWDIERASGPATSDPIQIGLLSIDLNSGKLINETEFNIITKNKIDWYGSKLHGITKDGKTLKRNGKILQNVMTQEEAITSLDSFIANGKYLVSHGAVDVETYDSLLRKNPDKESQNYERIKKIDSQRYFQQFLHKVSYVCLLFVNLRRET